jgi:hypothetical protein
MGAGALFGDLVFAHETTPLLANRAKATSRGDELSICVDVFALIEEKNSWFGVPVWKSDLEELGNPGSRIVS